MQHGNNPQPDYFELVERQFGLRRGGRLMLSPRDWQLLQKWYDDGLPVGVVLLGINRAFDRFEASQGGVERINSLRYCRPHVQAAWQEHRERGDPATPAPLAVAVEHLQRSAAACDGAANDARATTRGALRAAASSLEGLAARAADAALPVDEIDAEARRIQQQLEDALGPERDRMRLPGFSPWS